MLHSGKRRLFCFFLLLVCLALFSANCSAAELKDVIKQVEPAVGIVWVNDKKGDPYAHGTGFFITADGEFITNRHVMEGAYSANIEMANGTRYRVNKVLASHPKLDMVKLQVETRQEKVPFLNLAASLPERGDRVLVYGNPKEFKWVLTEGIVSAIQDVHIEGGDTWIQFTAPVSHGNSGGPLISMNGDVQGIVTWGRMDGQNLNFALPIYELRNLLDYPTGPDYAAPGGDAPMIPKKGTKVSTNEKPVVLVYLLTDPILQDYAESRKLIYDSVFGKIDQNKYVIRDASHARTDILKILDGYINPAKEVDLTLLSKELLVDLGRKANFDYILALRMVISRANVYSPDKFVLLKTSVKLLDVNQNKYLYYDVISETGTDSNFWVGGNLYQAGLKAVQGFARDFPKLVILP
ncbi:MAG: S1C family serine protease [Negativicutes bacterium]|nr:S1C family serine protease [Negativicutes bacterium]